MIIHAICAGQLGWPACCVREMYTESSLLICAFTKNGTSNCTIVNRTVSVSACRQLLPLLGVSWVLGAVSDLVTDPVDDPAEARPPLQISSHRLTML
jgi:hypothetical protein